jgi:hypothetical protein
MLYFFWSRVARYALCPVWGECLAAQGAQLPTLLESHSINNHEVIIAIVNLRLLRKKRLKKALSSLALFTPMKSILICMSVPYFSTPSDKPPSSSPYSYASSPAAHKHYAPPTALSQHLGIGSSSLFHFLGS